MHARVPELDSLIRICNTGGCFALLLCLGNSSSCNLVMWVRWDIAAARCATELFKFAIISFSG